MTAQSETPEKLQPDLDLVIEPREYRPVPVDYGERDMHIEKFVPSGPCCRIAHYELHVRTVNRVFVDTIELAKGCAECGVLHDGECRPLTPSWPRCEIPTCDKGRDWHMKHSPDLWKNALWNWC
jgi:hypothetical protein